MGLGESNLKTLTPEMDNMAGNCQNYWFPTKTNPVKKSVPNFLAPRKYKIDHSNEVLNFISCQGPAKILKVKVGGW